MRQPIAQFAASLGQTFADESLLEQALTHRSAGALNNERLEFLGDALLGHVVANELYRRFPTATEGQLSRLRSSLVRKESLAEAARALELGKYLQLGPGELRTGGHARSSILADGLEAVIAAVFLDAGATAAERVILDIMRTRLDALTLDDGLRKDSKTRLQEHLQARGFGLPDYEMPDIQGEAHAQRFRCGCTVDAMKLRGEGEGSSRRKAEQAAAADVLRRLGAMSRTGKSHWKTNPDAATRPSSAVPMSANPRCLTASSDRRSPLPRTRRRPRVIAFSASGPWIGGR